MVADKWMNGRNVKAMTCHADCYSFPHRKGSQGCKFNPDGSSRYGAPLELPGVDIGADF